MFFVEKLSDVAKFFLPTQQKKPHKNYAVIFGGILVTVGPDWGWL